MKKKIRICDKTHKKIHSSCGNVKIRNLDTQYISYLQSNDSKSPYEMKKKQGDKEILLILCLFNPLKPVHTTGIFKNPKFCPLNVFMCFVLIPTRK